MLNEEKDDAHKLNTKIQEGNDEKKLLKITIDN